MPLIIAGFAAVPAERTEAVDLPAGFTDQVVTNLPSPTALAFTPDGRMLVTSQTGQLRIVQNDVLVATPAIDLSTRMCLSGERGLLGVAVDPLFTTNRFVYLFWTAKKAGCPRLTANTPVNRVSRFVLPATNVIDASTETVLIDNIPSPAGNHNAGDLAFGKDGFLYVTVGDGGCDYADFVNCAGANDASRDKHVLVGKVLRITRTGGVPPSNPFATTGGRCNLTGKTTVGKHCQETFAWGLRNPFRFAFDPNAASTRFYINDVGQEMWEEINLGVAGADYGWNVREGHCAAGSTVNCGAPPPGMTNPIHDYSHAAGCASITGGAFVPNGLWPPEYEGAYLFGDYVCGSIFAMTPGAGGFDVTTLAGGLGSSSAVHLAFGPMAGTQALYYTTYAGGGQIRRISFTGDANRTPTAAMTATPASGPTPLRVVFDGSGSSDPDGDPLVYQWDFGDGGAVVQTSTPTIDHTYATGGRFTATLRVSDDNGATSAPTTLPITPANRPPTVTITAPAAGTRFVAGQATTLRATATDPEDGTLPATSMRWEVTRHHNSHTHPFLPATSGAQVAITYPGPEDSNDFSSYLVATVTATDSSGTSATQTIDLRPKDAIVIDDAAAREGASGTSSAVVPVTLHRQACAGACPTTTVKFATAPGTASGGSDFVTTSGTLTFAPGETTKQLQIGIRGDAVVEGDERFTVKLSAPSATATLRDGAATVLVLSDENAPSVPIRINAGGPLFTSPTSGTWLADRGSIGGATAVVSTAIANTTDDKLYQSERSAMTGYHLLVPNGSYRVRLHFAEVSSCCSAIGSRVFGVAVEDQPFLDTFDIRAETSRATALVREVTTVVDDGIVDITFSPNVKVPKISAIEILPLTGAPDLVVTALTWSPASVATGNAVTFTASIKNVGTSPTPAGVIHGVSFLVDGNLKTWSDTHTKSLAPGESVTLSANGGPTGQPTWIATTGPHTVVVHVDRNNRIAGEASEGNNTLQRVLTAA